ncbi:hypothetical protein BaRGS_00021591 [Batillaria attramentaria]|uniref:Uncharacterized protein n=1 Tax=Batillaria attramentaria TaxID=370345 RepID=A0ABD0KJ33_9CAEN
MWKFLVSIHSHCASGESTKYYTPCLLIHCALQSLFVLFRSLDELAMPAADAYFTLLHREIAAVAPTHKHGQLHTLTSQTTLLYSTGSVSLSVSAWSEVQYPSKATPRLSAKTELAHPLGL